MSDRLKGIAKGGWHPKGKGESGKESWRSDFKGANTVAGWMGKGKGPTEAARDHQSTPLSALKDPDSFGPPPKHVDYYGPAAASSSSSRPAGGGALGSPVSHDGDSARARLQAKKEAQARAEEEANKPPPGPYRADTTGLSTAHLPKPPIFRPNQGTPPPPPASRPSNGPPRLPPRLPPRQNSHPDAYSQPPPPPYTPHAESSSNGFLNQGAMNRLGKAGISVSGLEIGGGSPSPPIPPQQTANSSLPATRSPAAPSNHAPQIGELQSRFAKMTTSSKESQSPTTGTTWAEKQAALRTASNLRDDPSKVSFSDIRGGASTANNFRERHGEQAATGWRAASNLGQRFGEASQVTSASTPPLPQSPLLPAQGGIKKKPPPPPPKRRELSSDSSQPPPVPLATKPKF